MEFLFVCFTAGVLHFYCYISPLRPFISVLFSNFQGLLATQDEAVLDWSADHADSAAPEVRGALATLLLDFATCVLFLLCFLCLFFLFFINVCFLLIYFDI